jgi:hypothetical protein
MTALVLLALAQDVCVSPDVPHPGTDQIFWVPTLAQAEEASKATGRPIFLMGYVASWDGW